MYLGSPQLPSPCSASSPLEVGQLLLQQEYVGFELVPLLKDLLKLFPTEAALPYVGGALWLLRGIRLQKEGLIRAVPWRALLTLCHYRNATGSDRHRETWEARVLQQMTDQCSS